MRSILRLLGLARHLWPWYAGIIVCGVLGAATGLLTPFILKWATDEVVASLAGHGGGVTAVLWLAGGLLLTDLANTVITNIGGYLGDTMAVRLRATLSSRYFEKLLSLPQGYFDSELSGRIISRLQRSIAETTSFLNSFANSFFPMLISVIAALIISAVYSPLLALLLLVIYPVFTWLTTLTSKRWQRLEHAKNVEFDIAGGRFAEVIGQIRVVKSFGQELRELGHFDERFATATGLTNEQSRFWHRMDVARRGALNLVFFGVYAIIFVQTVQAVFTLGEMVLLLQLVAMARQPVMAMSYLVDSSQRAITGSRDYLDVMAETPEPGPDPESAPADNPSGPHCGVIEFQDASFGYGGGDAVLTDVSFRVGHGERIALVGESGGGKTTLVSLLLGLYPLGSGSIRIDGRDISELPLGQVRDCVGVVFQDPALFSGTIRENIGYGRPDATDEEIVAVARRANAHGFVSALKDGYDSEIGERGIKLSGGQKQRIAVARAMLKDAPILVLDEATSSLDSKAERLVQDGLEELMAKRTTLIIAHRLSTISAVDRIVTLRDGRVDEIGTPAELAATDGIYAELLALQASASKQDRKRLQAYDILR